MSPFMKLSGCFALLAVLLPMQAHAYLDPGTGSMILQSLAAGLVVITFYGRTLYRRVKGMKSFFSRRPAVGTDEKQKPGENSDV
jgi:Ca2+/H+ antiporter